MMKGILSPPRKQTSPEGPSRSEIANDMLEKTLVNLSNNMLPVVSSLDYFFEQAKTQLGHKFK